jgi:hypothetical protein
MSQDVEGYKAYLRMLDAQRSRRYRARRKRPRRRASECRNERAPLHSITSSARSSIDSGIVKPIDLAALR